MNPFLSTSSDDKKVRPSQVLGGAMGWFEDEGGFETEASVSSVVKGAGGVVAEAFSLFTDIVGIENKDSKESKKFPTKGSIEFNKAQSKAEEEEKKKKEAEAKKIFYQAMKDEQLRAQMAKDRMLFEEEIDDITTNMSTEEKNKLLHYQSSYKDRSIYQKAELRRKIIEQRRQAEKQQKETAIPSPAKQAGALDTAFEGASGSLGKGGSANLSSTGGGAQ